MSLYFLSKGCLLLKVILFDSFSVLLSLEVSQFPQVVGQQWQRRLKRRFSCCINCDFEATDRSIPGGTLVLKNCLTGLVSGEDQIKTLHTSCDSNTGKQMNERSFRTFLKINDRMRVQGEFLLVHSQISRLRLLSWWPWQVVLWFCVELTALSWWTQMSWRVKTETYSPGSPTDTTWRSCSWSWSHGWAGNASWPPPWPRRGPDPAAYCSSQPRPVPGPGPGASQAPPPPAQTEKCSISQADWHPPTTIEWTYLINWPIGSICWTSEVKNTVVLKKRKKHEQGEWNYILDGGNTIHLFLWGLNLEPAETAEFRFLLPDSMHQLGLCAETSVFDFSAWVMWSHKHVDTCILAPTSYQYRLI